MKLPKILRPEIECECTRPIFGRLIFPFYAALVSLRCLRVAKIQLTLNGKTIATHRVLIVPKITGVDALE
jgi:hypothetical protein